MFGRVFKLLRSRSQKADTPKADSAEKPFVDPFANEHADPLPETPQAPKAWLAIGLDGALAFDNGQGFGGPIGEPVPNTVQRLKDWVEHRRLEVKVLTPRAATEAGAQAVRDWLSSHNLPPLEVTAQKDLHMVEFWSARCVQVISNTGQSVGSSPRGLDKTEDASRPAAVSTAAGAVATGVSDSDPDSDSAQTDAANSGSLNSADGSNNTGGADGTSGANSTSHTDSTLR